MLVFIIPGKACRIEITDRSDFHMSQFYLWILLDTLLTLVELFCYKK